MPLWDVSQRELGVLCPVAMGLTNKEIAQQLFIATRGPATILRLKSKCRNAVRCTNLHALRNGTHQRGYVVSRLVEIVDSCHILSAVRVAMFPVICVPIAGACEPE